MKAQPTAITASKAAGEAEASTDLAPIGDQTDIGDLAAVLVVLEDFLLHADTHTVEDLAGYPMTRPDDPHAWVAWVAALLGEHAAALRALTPTNQALPTHQLIGEPR